MASTIAGTRLTEQHRLAQLSVRARALDDFMRIWPAFHPEDPFGSWGPVEQAALTLIGEHRNSSAALGAGYYRDFRAAELGTAGRIVPISAATAADQAAAIVALRVTGPLTVQRLEALHAPQPAATAFVRVSGAIGRLVLNGGRDTIEQASRNDERAFGYARVVSGHPCYFCAMLASRGPVYKAETVGFRAHDHCACAAQPVLRAGAAWPPRGREFQQLWNQTTAGTSGQDSIVAFRRAYEDAAA